MPSEIAVAVDYFLRFFRAEGNSVQDIEKLMELLDQLAWLAHGAQFEFDEHEYPEVKELDHPVTFKIAERWLQGMRQSTENADTTAIDAIMDLSEIADEMEEIRRRFLQNSDADALFHFQLGFQSHWGHHLRSLQKALHDWYW